MFHFWVIFLALLLVFQVSPDLKPFLDWIRGLWSKRCSSIELCLKELSTDRWASSELLSWKAIRDPCFVPPFKAAIPPRASLCDQAIESDIHSEDVLLYLRQ